MAWAFSYARVRFLQRGFSFRNVLVKFLGPSRDGSRVYEQLPQGYAEHGGEVYQLADAQRPPL